MVSVDWFGTKIVAASLWPSSCGEAFALALLDEAGELVGVVGAQVEHVHEDALGVQLTAAQLGAQLVEALLAQARRAAQQAAICPARKSCTMEERISPGLINFG